MLTAAIVDFEIYNASGVRTFQWYSSGLTLNPFSPRLFSTTWQVLSRQAAGSYTLVVGVFGPGWTPQYFWGKEASLTVT
jgi:hypothetical protein